MFQGFANKNFVKRAIALIKFNEWNIYKNKYNIKLFKTFESTFHIESIKNYRCPNI